MHAIGRLTEIEGGAEREEEGAEDSHGVFEARCELEVSISPVCVCSSASFLTAVLLELGRFNERLHRKGARGKISIDFQGQSLAMEVLCAACTALLTVHIWQLLHAA